MLHWWLGAVPGYTMRAHLLSSLIYHVRLSQILQLLLLRLGVHTALQHGRTSSFTCTHCTGMLPALALGVHVAASGTPQYANSFLAVVAVA